MIWNALEKHRDIGLLIMRVGLGLGFLFYHGWGKLVGGPERWTSVGGAMKRIGIDFFPAFWGFMAAITESLGGLLLALGLFTRPVCLLLGFTMLMASIQHYASGRGNPGNAIKFLFVSVGLFIIGPGKYSLDEWLSKKKSDKGTK